MPPPCGRVWTSIGSTVSDMAVTRTPVGVRRTLHTAAPPEPLLFDLFVPPRGTSTPPTDLRSTMSLALRTSPLPQSTCLTPLWQSLDREHRVVPPHIQPPHRRATTGSNETGRGTTKMRPLASAARHSISTGDGVPIEVKERQLGPHAFDETVRGRRRLRPLWSGVPSKSCSDRRAVRPTTDSAVYGLLRRNRCQEERNSRRRT